MFLRCVFSLFGLQEQWVITIMKQIIYMTGSVDQLLFRYITLRRTTHICDEDERIL